MTVEVEGRNSQRPRRQPVGRGIVRVIVLTLALVVYFGIVTALAAQNAPAAPGSAPPATQNSVERKNDSQMSDSKPRKRAAKRNAEPQLSIREKLERNTALAEKLQSMLPWGMDLFAVCDGFRSLPDLVAAAHASNNLGIRLLAIRDAMAGKRPASLARIIRKLNPNVNPAYEERRALQAARADLEQIPWPRQEAPVVAGR